jgi:thymidylate kinase
MRVICIEGPHGCGKTKLVESFRAAGYPVLDEMFMEMPAHFDGLEAQSMVREVAWVVHWFERVLRYRQEHPDVSLVVADRSPFSAVIYANEGQQLKACIATQMKELNKYTPVRIKNVLLQVDPAVHWQRICSRLEQEPERVRYNEACEEWMWTVRSRYEDLYDVWDAVFDNNQAGTGAIDSLQARILSSLDDM